MLTLTAAQLDAWIAAVLYPAARVLALVATAPAFNNVAIPRRIRLLIGLAITVGLIPALPPLAAIQPGSGVGLAVLVQQMLIGATMGFAMRVAFAAIDVAGDLIGLQMGLSFAVFFDPQSTGQTAVVAEFVGLLAVLIFLALDGHLMLLDVLARSFTLLPVSVQPYPANGWEQLARWGAVLFASGMLLSLPIVATLLITNIALGVLTRAAPQLNLFAVGFPVTLLVGFTVLLLALPIAAPVMERLFSEALATTAQLIDLGLPPPR